MSAQRLRTRRLLPRLALLLAAALCGGSRPARGQAESHTHLDGLAVVVGALAPEPGAIILLQSDVELRARMAMLREGSLADALGTVPTPLLQASLEALVGEALIALEARRLDLDRPDRAALHAERTRFIGTGRAGAAMRELLAALGVSERELASSIERRALVDAFLRANLEGSLDVAPSELERLFASEAHPFRDLPYEQARDAFARWLSTRRLEQAVQSWVVALKQRTAYRVLVRYDG